MGNYYKFYALSDATASYLNGYILLEAIHRYGVGSGKRYVWSINTYK